jgi:hypothetical protein
MTVRSLSCAILIFFLFAGAVTAVNEYPDSLVISIVSPNQGVLIGNGQDLADVEVCIYNQSENITLPGLRVDFALMNATLGAFSPVSNISDENGCARTILTSGITPGNTVVNATVFYEGNPVQNAFVPVKILQAAPDQIVFTSSRDYVVANGKDYSLLNVHVLNGTYPIPNLQVNFVSDLPSLGTVSPNMVYTDMNGNGSTSFLAATGVGYAPIRATVSYTVDGSALYSTSTFQQKVIGPYPDQISLVSDRTWVVANGSDRCRVTLQAYNSSTDYYIPNLTVGFSVSNTTMGSMSPASNLTLPSGITSSVYTTGTKSGIAQILGKVYYKVWGETENVTRTYEQNVDHDTPYRISLYEFSTEVMVGNITPFNIWLQDRWGNPIDDRNVAENVSMVVSSPSTTFPDRAGFWNGTGYASGIIQPVDFEGKAAVTLKVDTQPGSNIVLVSPPSPIASTYYTVTGAAISPPVYMTAQVIPAEGWVFADGDKVFTLIYTLKDAYGNGLANRPIYFSTDLGEFATIWTNPFGIAQRSYGPKSSVGTVTLNATAVENMSLSKILTVRFTNTAPVDMLLTASPQSMPSRDVPSWQPSSVTAKVVDENGNPVGGENVSFQIIHPPSYPTSSVLSPSFSAGGDLSTASGITDNETGQAVVLFMPGSFVTDDLSPLYTQQASASCIVRATWVNPNGTPISKDVPMNWKNYPYLSVQTFVSPTVVNVSDNIDITIMLIGDGFALQPKPIDVMLCMDRSGSMGYDSPTRISSAKNAAKLFVSKMNSSQDRLGLVSYAGYTSGTQTRVDAVLGSAFPTVNTKIDSLTASGATETRVAMKASIDQIISNPNPNPKTIKAVILMTDGNWNWQGTPLGHGTGWAENSTYYSFSTSNLEPNNYRYYNGLGGTLERWEHCSWYSCSYDWRCLDGEFTEQNMSIYAKNHNIRLYMISFASTLDPTAVQAMNIMANATGGFYEHAPDATKLNEIYTRIAGQLKEDAGVNTQMDINMGSIEVNNEPEDGGGVFEYVSTATSTVEDFYWSNGTRLSGFPTAAYNQSDQWVPPDYTLTFNIGTIKLNQIWKATYSLKVLKDGNINIFGPSSDISFNNGENHLSLPKLYITALPKMTNVSISEQFLTESDITTTVIDVYIREWTWTRNYTGNQTLVEKYYVSVDGGKQWIQVGSMTFSGEEARANPDGIFRMDLRTLPVDITQMVDPKFRVVGYAEDVGAPVVRITSINLLFNPNRVFIKLE